MASLTTSDALADAAVAFAVEQVEALVERHLPGFRIPGVFAGHPVGPDVRADLLFTLGMLQEAGVDAIAGAPTHEVLEAVLAPVDGARTHTFYSYRVAETLQRMGRRGPDLPPNVAEACDSTAAIAGLDGGTLPQNYAAVLARCEVGRAALGLIADDDPALVDLVDRTRRLLTANASGHLDDSRSGIARYDIYTVDVRLFTEPFADRLGSAWTAGTRAAVDLAERVAMTNGAAIAWGRSTGALSLCLTLELAGLVCRHDLGADRAAWITRGANALDELHRWFADGLINAHQYRSTYGYRGPFRRLQMTLDCLGKVVDAALALRDGEVVEGAPWDAAFPSRDELVVLDPVRNASVWTYRSRDLAFVLPLVGATLSDYLPAPQNPRLFEVPVDSPLVTATPLVVLAGRVYAAGLPPTSVTHDGEGRVTTRHETFHLAGQMEVDADARVVAGERVAEYRVEGRTLHVDERLVFPDEVPHAISLQIAETTGRPLRVDLGPGTATTIDTAGIKEWRSFWGELPVVHQVDVEPAREVTLSWSVTPKLRVLSTAHEHHYHRSLYDPLRDHVVDSRFPMGRLNDRRALLEMLERCDIFHLHWPEWFLGHDVARNESFIDDLRSARVRIVWTQHNLVPHVRDGRLVPVYELWASVADGVLHHSEWGRRAVSQRYRFRDDAVHALVPHPHFGHLAQRRDASARHALEDEMGLRHDVLRLGIVGAPRPEKDVEMVMRAVARSKRNDIELVVFSLAPGQEPVRDDRIHAVAYEMVERGLYEARLGLIDVLVLPFARGEMLTTGTVGDAVAHGIPVLASDWEFLADVLGDAAIVYGSTEDDLVQAVDGLDRAALARAADASAALREPWSAEAVAGRLLRALEAVGTSKL